jgi:hypothetical protein
LSPLSKSPFLKVARHAGHALINAFRIVRVADPTQEVLRLD